MQTSERTPTKIPCFTRMGGAETSNDVYKGLTYLLTY